MSSNSNYRVIGSKVTPADKLKLITIAETFGLSLFGLMQNLMLVALRFFDRHSPISNEHATMLNNFGRPIDKAIVFLNRKQSSRPQVLAIDKDGRGRTTESYNLDAMLADLLRATDPHLLRVLEDEKMRQHDFSLTHTLHELVLQRINATVTN